MAAPRGAAQYSAGRELGEGTWGKVFLGTRLVDGRKVAIKRIKQNPAQADLGLSFSALRELRLMREMRHENLVSLIDVYAQDAHLHLVLEVLATDLEKVLYETRCPLEPADIKSYMQMMLSGLAFLHQHWILHRDLAPGNIFISAEGVVKLADFGLSRTYGSPLQLMSPEVVTQWYRAPELLFGACEYDAGIDMWSIGCLFAELWIRQPLFQGNGKFSELDQLGKIFMIMGTPSEATWPDVGLLCRFVDFQATSATPLSQVLPENADSNAAALLGALLGDGMNPNKRLAAVEALEHRYFEVQPEPTPPSQLPR